MQDGSGADAPYLVEWSAEDAVFRINRPHKRNALTKAILDGLGACLDQIESRGIRSLIIIGEGERAFCAGTDLAEASAMAMDALDAKNQQATDLLFRIYNSPIISVAALNGLAYGGGLELAMACTLRIAAPHADVSLPEIKLGVIPSYGGTQYLPAIVGPARALDLMLTGRAITAEECLALGLVTRIADTDSPLLDQARAMARSITCYSQVAIDCIRRAVAASGPVVTRAGLKAENAERLIVRDSADSREGIQAFLEKRPPRFQNK
jgi:enoyl-CoA hydratase